MSKMHDLRDYIGLHRYIKEANFYAAYIKYQFRTGKTKTGGYAESDARKAHFVGDELMGDDELTSELTE
jgi:hypothetical protein